MSGLSAFLYQNAIKPENKKIAVSKRFLDSERNPILWEIRSVTTNEDEAIRRECAKRKPVSGKGGQHIQETDFSLYLGKLAAKCIVYPNLNDAELQDSYGAMGADALLKEMLTPGEYTELTLKIQEINGYDKKIDELIEEAKN